MPHPLRLDKNDAEFVAVYHTNAFGFGTAFNVGHVDYWIDGGMNIGGAHESIFVLFGIFTLLGIFDPV